MEVKNLIFKCVDIEKKERLVKAETVEFISVSKYKAKDIKGNEVSFSFKNSCDNLRSFIKDKFKDKFKETFNNEETEEEEEV